VGESYLQIFTIRGWRRGVGFYVGKGGKGHPQRLEHNLGRCRKRGKTDEREENAIGGGS